MTAPLARVGDTIEPAGPRPGAPTSTIIPGYRIAQLKISAALDELERTAHAVAVERDGIAGAHEAALRVVGQLRARVEELETFLRHLVDGSHDITDADPDLALYEARVLLGLDGRTGGTAEVGHAA